MYNIDWDKQPLGEMTDEALADKIFADTGEPVTKFTVKYQRAKRNIPPFIKNTLPSGINWDEEERLGKMPDPKLAYLLGVTKTTIKTQREKRAIPPFTQDGRGVQKSC